MICSENLLKFWKILTKSAPNFPSNLDYRSKTETINHFFEMADRKLHDNTMSDHYADLP